MQPMRRLSGLTASFLGAALFLGCQSSNRSGEGTGILRAGLPPGAEVMTEGTTQVTFTPEEDGRVYLYDVKEDRVVGRYFMRRGQRLAMDALSGRATIDGNEVRVAPTNKESSYQIYFERATIE